MAMSRQSNQNSSRLNSSQSNQQQQDDIQFRILSTRQYRTGDNQDNNDNNGDSRENSMGTGKGSKGYLGGSGGGPKLMSPMAGQFENESDIFGDGGEGGGVEPSINESIRSSIAYSFVSSESQQVGLTKNEEQKISNLEQRRQMTAKDQHVMNRMNWITYLKVLFDQLESFNQNKQKHVENVNFVKGLQKIKNLLPLLPKAEYFKNTSELAFTYKQVEDGLTSAYMPQYLTWDHIIDVFLSQQQQPPSYPNPNPNTVKSSNVKTYYTTNINNNSTNNNSNSKSNSGSKNRSNIVNTAVNFKAAPQVVRHVENSYSDQPLEIDDEDDESNNSHSNSNMHSNKGHNAKLNPKKAQQQQQYQPSNNNNINDKQRSKDGRGDSKVVGAGGHSVDSRKKEQYYISFADSVIKMQPPSNNQQMTGEGAPLGMGNQILGFNDREDEDEACEIDSDDDDDDDQNSQEANSSSQQREKEGQVYRNHLKDGQQQKDVANNAAVGESSSFQPSRGEGGFDEYYENEDHEESKGAGEHYQSTQELMGPHYQEQFYNGDKRMMLMSMENQERQQQRLNDDSIRTSNKTATFKYPSSNIMVGVSASTELGHVVGRPGSTLVHDSYYTLKGVSQNQQCPNSNPSSNPTSNQNQILTSQNYPANAYIENMTKNNPNISGTNSNKPAMYRESVTESVRSEQDDVLTYEDEVCQVEVGSNTNQSINGQLQYEVQEEEKQTSKQNQTYQSQESLNNNTALVDYKDTSFEPGTVGSQQSEQSSFRRQTIVGNQKQNLNYNSIKANVTKDDNNNTVISQNSSHSNQSSYKNSQSQFSSNNNNQMNNNPNNTSKVSSSQFSNSIMSPNENNNTSGSSPYIDLEYQKKGFRNFEMDFKQAYNGNPNGDKKILRSINLAQNLLARVPLNLEKSLMILNLSFNKLKSLSGIESCSNLKFLNANGNLLSTITGVGSLSQIKELYLAHNQLYSVKDLGGLKNMILLDLSQNKLLEAEKLQPLQNLKKLTILSLQGNILTNKTNYAQMVFKLLGSVKILDPQNIKEHSQPFYQNMDSICFTNMPASQIQQETNPVHVSSNNTKKISGNASGGGGSSLGLDMIVQSKQNKVGGLSNGNSGVRQRSKTPVPAEKRANTSASNQLDSIHTPRSNRMIQYQTSNIVPQSTAISPNRSNVNKNPNHNNSGFGTLIETQKTFSSVNSSFKNRSIKQQQSLLSNNQDQSSLMSQTMGSIKGNQNEKNQQQDNLLKIKLPLAQMKRRSGEGNQQNSRQIQQDRQLGDLTKNISAQNKINNEDSTGLRPRSKSNLSRNNTQKVGGGSSTLSAKQSKLQLENTLSTPSNTTIGGTNTNKEVIKTAYNVSLMNNQQEGGVRKVSVNVNLSKTLNLTGRVTPIRSNNLTPRNEYATVVNNASITNSTNININNNNSVFYASANRTSRVPIVGGGEGGKPGATNSKSNLRGYQKHSRSISNTEEMPDGRNSSRLLPSGGSRNQINIEKYGLMTQNSNKRNTLQPHEIQSSIQKRNQQSSFQGTNGQQFESKISKSSNKSMLQASPSDGGEYKQLKSKNHSLLLSANRAASSRDQYGQPNINFNQLTQRQNNDIDNGQILKSMKASLPPQISTKQQNNYQNKISFTSNAMGTVSNSGMGSTIITTTGNATLIQPPQTTRHNAGSTLSNKNSFLFENIGPNNGGRHTPTNRPSSQLQKFIIASKDSKKGQQPSQQKANNMNLTVNTSMLPPRANQSSRLEIPEGERMTPLSSVPVTGTKILKTNERGLDTSPARIAGGAYQVQQSRANESVSSISSRSCSSQSMNNYQRESYEGVKKLKVDLTLFANNGK